MAVGRARIVFHPGAADDLAEILDHYAQVDPTLSTRFRARFREQIDRLARFPRSGAFLFDEFRRVVIKRFPYLVVYLVGDDSVSVLAVLPFRRDPEWIRQIAASRSTGN